MKKLMMPIAAVLLMASCNKETAPEIENLDNQNIDIAKIQSVVDRGFNDSGEEAEYQAYLKDFKSLNQNELNLYFEMQAKAETDKMAKKNDQYTSYQKDLYYENSLRAYQLASTAGQEKFGKNFNQLSPQELEEVYAINNISESLSIANQVLDAYTVIPEEDLEGIGLDNKDFTTLDSKGSCRWIAAAQGGINYTDKKANRGNKGNRNFRWGSDSECEYLIIFYENRRGSSKLEGYSAWWSTRWAIGRLGYRWSSYKGVPGDSRWYLQLGKDKRVHPDNITGVLSVPK